MLRILRLSLRNFFSSSVSNSPSSTMDPASGRTLCAIGRAYFFGSGKSTAEPSWVSAPAFAAAAASWPSSSSTPHEPAAGHGLVGAGDQAHQARFGVQRLEHRHRGHGGAVGVRDDPLARFLDRLRVDLADDQRDVRVHPPRRRVVDHRGTGGGEPFRLRLGGRATGGEQRDVQTGRIRGRRVLDDDFPVTPRKLRTGGPRRSEVPHFGDRETPFRQQTAHDTADLAGRPDHAYPQTFGHQRPLPA